MSEVFALGLPVLFFLSASVLLGTMLQRLTGQGFGMIATPMMAFVAPEFIPTTVLLIGLTVGLGSAALDVSAVRLRELPAGLMGRALGAGVAAWLATWLSGSQSIAVIVALFVYLGIALSLSGIRVAITDPTLFVAGTVAGIMGTLTAVGAPPMALLYQHVEAQRSAAMQNAFFFFGMVVSIAALTAVGLVGWRHVALALLLLPAAACGIWASAPLARRLKGRSIRPWALSIAGMAATILLVSAL